MAKTPKKIKEYGCLIKQLPADLAHAAALQAIEINPTNRPPERAMGLAVLTDVPEAARLGVLTSKYWGAAGRKLGVTFLDSPPAALKSRILAAMNQWSKFCSMSFQESSQGEVRIARSNGGYWSYLGTDILSIPVGQQTMNLQGFGNSTPDSEIVRVVCHETGHTCGFPHEHMMPEIVARLDEQKTINYFWQFQGWNETVTRQQVLTPIGLASIMKRTVADQDSIMCYQLPASITKDGQPIRGGSVIDELDKGLASSVYPLAVQPPPPPPPPVGGDIAYVAAFDSTGKEIKRWK